MSSDFSWVLLSFNIFFFSLSLTLIRSLSLTFFLSLPSYLYSLFLPPFAPTPFPKAKKA